MLYILLISSYHFDRAQVFFNTVSADCSINNNRIFFELVKVEVRSLSIFSASQVLVNKRITRMLNLS